MGSYFLVWRLSFIVRVCITHFRSFWCTPMASIFKTQHRVIISQLVESLSKGHIVGLHSGPKQKWQKVELKVSKDNLYSCWYLTFCYRSLLGKQRSSYLVNICEWHKTIPKQLSKIIYFHAQTSVPNRE